MKHVLIGIALFSVVATSAFAATPATEPKLPSDIATWEKSELPACTKYLGKKIEAKMLRKEAGDTLKQIIVFYLNGEKIDQREFSRTGDSPSSYVRYIRNSPDGNWLMYDKVEGTGSVSGDRMLAELGLTSAELADCNRE